MANCKTIENSIKYNTFMIALTCYHRSVQNVNFADLNGITSGFVLNKCDSKEVDEHYFDQIESMVGGVIDSISYLCFLYLTKQIPKDTYDVVEDIVKGMMDRKDIYKRIMKKAMKKDKRCSINTVWKKIKRKKKR